MERLAMKGYMILGFVLALLVAPIQVHAQSSQPQPLNINGNIFDPMPALGSQTRPAAKARPTHHVKKHRTRSST
jgi:hypothetical protein